MVLQVELVVEGRELPRNALGRLAQEVLATEVLADRLAVRLVHVAPARAAELAHHVLVLEVAVQRVQVEARLAAKSADRVRLGAPAALRLDESALAVPQQLGLAEQVELEGEYLLVSGAHLAGCYGVGVFKFFIIKFFF